MKPTSTKEIAPQAATSEAKVFQLQSIRDKYKGETGATHALRILDALMTVGTLSTFEARRYLDVPHPAGRIKELRGAGHDIETLRRREQSEAGHPHSIAVYMLCKEAA